MNTNELAQDFAPIEAIFEQIVSAPASHHFAAPGRVNLIGEHTDYNDGFVLPCAIDRYTLAVTKVRDDAIVRVVATDYGQQVDTFDISQPIEHNNDKPWANYIRGVVSVLLARGYQFGGLDMVISGNIPQGAGLSSSASLEVLIAQCFNTSYDLKISPADMALISQQAENEFVGCMCGVMDQLISASGVEGHALLIDCRDLSTKPVSIPDGLNILIIDSNKPRGLVESEYNTRRQQCEAAADYFGVKALRDVELAQLDTATDLDVVTAKRARHVITENVRTLEAADALAGNDITRLSQLMAESHRSMRDDFEITVPEIDWLVATVHEYIGERGGVRMTGGGFGGCVIALVPDDTVESVQRVINEGYAAKFDRVATFYLCQAGRGAGEV
ncbi:MAG: Galactokinase (EC [uncultured Thiotrichaceae bacterium]|uniref:Galactokinase n=1 Tax=uncultured Thiotrichaceae bacterium TaxID=298394 RepID=A0A6S6SCA1_9GAMM|nr:MAG: Galactokinase (EC [uncultured Thiotrichaceae bacterium]